MSEDTVRADEISFDDFLKVQIVTGTIVDARVNEKARVPAFVIEIDFGPLGRRTSSAQLTANYTPDTLRGKQIVAVANFPSKRIAGVKSEVLILRGGVGDPRRGAARADLSRRGRCANLVTEAWRRPPRRRPAGAFSRARSRPAAGLPPTGCRPRA